jgi:hypothetical protein
MRALMRFLRRLWYFGSDTDSAISAQRKEQHDHHGSLRAAGWTGTDAPP